MLRAEGLTFAYSQDVSVIQDISFELQDGEIFGIIGPNGSGKTTLLSLIAGLLTPQSGKVLLYGKTLSDTTNYERSRQLAFVSQSDAITLPFSVGEIVLMGRQPFQKFLGFETAEDFKAADDALQLTECLHLKNRSIQSLSGGERQRVILARALAQETPLILLDEPTAHLDIRYQFEICEVLHRLSQEEKRSIIVTLHDINLASLYCDRLLLLHNGKIHAHGRPQEVVTSENMATVYGVEVDISVDSETKRPYCRLLRRLKRDPLRCDT